MELQMAELLFSAPPRFDFAKVKACAERILGEELESPAPGDPGSSYLLVHKSHVVTYSDGRAPAQTAIFTADKSAEPERYTELIQQSWGFQECDTVVERARHTLAICELMARQLEPVERVRLFHGVLQALLECTEPDAIAFHHSQQVVHPQAYRESTSSAPILRPGALNVRFFNIENSDGDMLMDTRGLTEVGLHDLQCHFRDLDPDQVARVLMNTAIYVFENGPVIESGNTVAGVEEGTKWRCQFEEALVAPPREVLDLDPGARHAAGNRS
jgi:hypothetical protein